MKTIKTNLVRILFRGLVIDAKSFDGGIVNLTVRTDQQHSSAFGRLRQHLANAIYRAADLLHPRDYKGLPRVVQRVVGAHASNNGLPNIAGDYIVNRLPVHLANGDASYETFILYEGVENKELRLLGAASAGFSDEVAYVRVGGLHGLNKAAGDLSGGVHIDSGLVVNGPQKATSMQKHDDSRRERTTGAL